jgi:2-keto-4-pentenoate hydratase/2-oxohepta-3-ene-1,7-dioic acid hydratase in catechol pathway
LRRTIVALSFGMLTLAAIPAPGLFAIARAEAQQVTRYVRYDQGGTISWGVLEGQTIFQLSNAPYLDGTRTGQSVPLSSVRLKAPVDPKTVMMTAYNFRSHLGLRDPAPYPGLFIVPANSIVGPDENMIKPADTADFHYEAEMVIVIGRRAENVSVEDASDYVFGVSAGNDGSARDWQANDLQWVRAKGSRTFNAVGPYLVTGLDYSNLDIEGRLQGERVQGENTSDLLFSMDEMIAYISRYITLEPGDLVWTGTMGTTRRWNPGQVFEVEIEGVGVLRNTLVEGPALPPIRFE